VQIRQAEGNKIEGFLKVDGDKGESLLVDFMASSTPGGELSSLEVGGKKIVVATATTWRARWSAKATRDSIG